MISKKIVRLCYFLDDAPRYRQTKQFFYRLLSDPQSTMRVYFDAVYWSLVTISTVGYGDIIPQTTEGRFVAMVLIVSGIGVISFFTSIIVSAFAEKLRMLREQRVFAELRRARDFTVVCGYGRVSDTHTSVFELEEQEFHFHPPGDFVVQSNDILVLFGDDFSLNHFKDKLGKSGL